MIFKTFDDCFVIADIVIWIRCGPCVQIELGIGAFQSEHGGFQLAYCEWISLIGGKRQMELCVGLPVCPHIFI